MRKFFAFVAAACTAMTMNAITVADAITEGMKLDSMGVSTEEYTVEGYVINAMSFSTQYMNQSWYMADAANATESDFEAYNCYPIDGNDTLKVLNGDKVSVTGKLKKYYNKNAKKYIIEIEKGNATFISKTEGDHSIDKGVEEVTVAQALEIGAALADNKSTEKQYTIKGYVSAINVKSSDAWSDQYKNQSFWVMDTPGSGKTNAEGAFYVYRGKPETGEAVAEGAYVEFTCAIKKYGSGDNAVIENEAQNITVKILGDAPTPEAINVTEAVQIALALGDNETSTANYAVVGYVANIKEPYTTENNYNNISFYLTDDATSTYGDLYCRRTKMSVEEGPTVVAGDKVLVIGKLTNNFYNDKNSAQIYQGKATIEAKSAIENILMNDTKINKVIVDGVVYIVRDGKIFTVQGQEVK